MDRLRALRLRFPSVRSLLREGALLAVLLLGAPRVGQAQAALSADPRVGLRAGWTDAGEASWNLERVGQVARPPGFFDPAAIGNLALANSDMAFQGNRVFVGNFHGFNIYDLSNPSRPELLTSVVCPGGQGDLSVFGHLLFMSVEENRGRVDCGGQGAPGEVNPDRFRGVRIFDIRDIRSPRQVAAVQTCRGSHTHSLLEVPEDPENVYVYVSGTGGVRSAGELEGCSASAPEADPEATALFRIEIIQVPLAAPERARVVSQPRVFADRESGAVAGLWPGGGHGPGSQQSAPTNHCHDITLFPALRLAAGACSGNGILLDISDPVNPVRVDEVIDPNFAYWHSATFNNDGTAIVFTDEWGGGTSARCRATDLMEWGANAIFRLRNGRMEFASYYKLPAAQTETENCVAHNGSLIPVPGRDIMVQGWYQGGISVFDFTDPERPFEIAFFDRGPIDATRLEVGGHWSAYWYNGYIYGSEIARGLDVLRLLPSEHLSPSELEAARLVQWQEFNPQEQRKFSWPDREVVARAYLDQLIRGGEVSMEEGEAIWQQVTRSASQAETRGEGGTSLASLVASLRGRAAEREGRKAERFRFLAETLDARAVAEVESQP